MKSNVIIRFLCLVGILTLLGLVYINTMSSPKIPPKESYGVQQNLNSDDQARIEFTKNYFEALKNLDKTKVKELSVGNFPFQNAEDRDTQFNQFWGKFAGRNFVFSKLIKMDEYEKSCNLVEVKEGENKFWFCVDGQPENGYRLVMYPQEVKPNKLEQRSVNSTLGIDLDLARRGFSEQYFNALGNRDIPILKKLALSDFDTSEKEKMMTESAQRYYDKFWERSGDKTLFADKIIPGKLLECNRSVFITYDMNTREQFFYSFCIKDIDPIQGLFSIDINEQPVRENLTLDQLKNN